MRTTFLTALLIASAVYCSDAIAQSTAGRERYFGGVFLNTTGGGLQTLDGGATWKNLSASEVDYYRNRHRILMGKESTAGVPTVAEVSVALYPNPAASEMKVVSHMLVEASGQLTIIDALGIERGVYTLDRNQQEQSVNLANLSNGHYTYVLTIGSKASSGSLAIQR